MAKNNTNKSGSSNEDVNMYMEIFSWAYKKQTKDYNRIVSLQQSYDNTVLSTAWPTNSKIPIAAFYESVEKALPLAVDYIFGPSSRVNLMPLEPGVGMDQVRKSEMALWDLVTYKMKIQRASLPTIKDVFKCGVGFGIVEPVYVSPPASFGLTLVGEGGEKTNTRVMKAGEPKLSLRYRYLTPMQVVVTPDGSNFNGENPVSVAYFFDSYNEDEFLSMYDSSILDGEKPLMLGNPKEIIAEARSNGFTSQTTIEDMIGKVGGISPKGIKPDSDMVPCRVPVLKVYDRFKRRHVWIANGTTIAYDRSDEYQTLRCPLIKATAWLDANRFYPMSTPEAYQKIGWTKNVIVNMFLDIMTLNLKRPLVYNPELFDREPKFGPNDKVRTSAADARMGAAYLEPVRVDPSTMTFYEIINGIGTSITGQKNFMDKNFTRGGGMAFQDLMSTTEGMDRLKGAVLDMTFLESVIEQALIYLQTTVTKEGVVVRRKEKASGSDKEDIVDVTITEDDLCHAYSLSVDLRGKARKGAMENAASLQIYDRKKESEFFDQWEVAAEHLCSSDEEVRRQLKSREEVAAIQKKNLDLSQQVQALDIQGKQSKLQEASQPNAQSVIPEGEL